MSDVPIIMLTALGSAENITKGLNLGADDYIVKPVTAEQLSARIQAVLRRVSRSKVARNPDRTAIFAYDNLCIDFDRHEVKVGNERVDLTPTEFRLLSLLAQHQGRMLPHDFLLREVWGTEYTNEVEYLRLYIGYLRRKLEKDASRSSLIQNEWGIGYRFG
jgi:two-component system KDP operon response regulator KdpE